MRHLLSRAAAPAVAAMLAATACDRSSDEDPPLIPLPGQAAQGKPARVASDPAPPPQLVPAAPAPTPTAEASAAPTVTPFAIPVPIPVPTSMPSLPDLPGLLSPLFGTSAPSATATPSAQPQADARVILYGTRWCPACRSLKTHLASRKVPYTFIDVENPRELSSPAGAHVAEMPANMRNGVPVTRVQTQGGAIQWVQGDDPERIERAYRAP